MSSKNLERIVEEVGALTLLEIADLVKLMEEKFGVSAAMPVAAAGAASAAPAAAEAEKSEYKVELLDSGANKIEAIKALRKVKKELGLTDAKKIIESAPIVIAEAASKADAQALKEALEAAGGKVKLS